jgi:hypothetical protein
MTGIIPDADKLCASGVRHPFRFVDKPSATGGIGDAEKRPHKP